MGRSWHRGKPGAKHSRRGKSRRVPGHLGNSWEALEADGCQGKGACLGRLGGRGGQVLPGHGEECDGITCATGHY